MNEQIEDLKQKAIDHVDAVDGGLGIENYRELVDLKFAELIIQRCGFYADIFEVLGPPCYMDPTETKPSDYIKKRFGVE